MFSVVSWSEYVQFVVVAMVLWYAVIVLLFYHTRIKKRLMRPRLRAQPVAAAGEDEVEPEEVPEQKRNKVHDSLQDVQTIIAEIKKVFAAVNNESSSESIVFSLREILTPYRELKYSEFKSALNDYIQAQISKTQLAEFTQEELDQIWNTDTD